MILIVSGTRHGRDDVGYWLDRFVARHGRPERVVLGDARGVDAAARAWAAKWELPCEVYRAQWAVFGDAAGGMRNQAMVEQGGAADWLVALPDRTSVGTWDCVRRARERGIRTVVIHPRVAT